MQFFHANAQNADLFTSLIIAGLVEDPPAGAGLSYTATLAVTDEDRTAATACAERHEYNNRAFAKQAKFFRGKNHFATIIRGYLGEIIVRRYLGLPHSIDDLVFDKPQKRPDLLEVGGVAVRLDMKTTEDGTVRVNVEAHHSIKKRPLAYVVADVRGGLCHIWTANADDVDGWQVRERPSAHYLCKLPNPPLHS